MDSVNHQTHRKEKDNSMRKLWHRILRCEYHSLAYVSRIGLVPSTSRLSSHTYDSFILDSNRIKSSIRSHMRTRSRSAGSGRGRRSVCLVSNKRSKAISQCCDGPCLQTGYRFRHVPKIIISPEYDLNGTIEALVQGVCELWHGKGLMCEFYLGRNKQCHSDERPRSQL
jgi:hypothetical protein